MLLSSPAAPASDLALDLFHPLGLTDLVAGPDRATDADDPLQLRAAMDDARRRSGARGVVDLLVGTLSRRMIRADADIDPYLDELKSACRQTRRWREAIPVFQRIVALNPGRRHEIAAELALVHGHLGEAAKGIALLETAYRGHRRLAARRRSPAFCLLGEVAATLLRAPDLARDIADLGRTLVPTQPVVTASVVTPMSTVDFDASAEQPVPTRKSRGHLRLVAAA